MPHTRATPSVGGHDPPGEGCSTEQRTRRPGLRLKINLVVLPLLVASLGGIVWMDYRHEVDAVMAAHALHAGPVASVAPVGPISPATSPEEVAGRALRMHAAYGITMLVVIAFAIDAAVWGFVIRPLDRIREGIAQMERGHWRIAAGVAAHDEMGRLSEDFRGMGLAIDALAGHLLHAERLATLALVSRRLQNAVGPQIERIGRTVAKLHHDPDSARLAPALIDVSEAAARIAATVQSLEHLFEQSASAQR